MALCPRRKRLRNRSRLIRRDCIKKIRARPTFVLSPCDSALAATNGKQSMEGNQSREVCGCVAEGQAGVDETGRSGNR